MSQTGIFIVIDGTDGSGKATQTKFLVERLAKEGIPYETISFPQYGKKSAAPVEEYLSGAYGQANDVSAKQASILYATDRFDASHQIRSWLRDGKVVIADRYVGSNMGHQGSKIENRDEREAFFRWNMQLEFETFTIPKPTMNLILHVPAETSLRLIAEREADGGSKHGLKKDVHEEDADHLHRSEQAYLHIAELEDSFQLITCVENNTLLPRETIHERIWSLVEPLIKR